MSSDSPRRIRGGCPRSVGQDRSAENSLIDDPNTDTASARASGSSGTVIVASGRVWSDRAPRLTVVGRASAISTGSGPSTPLTESSAASTLTDNFVTPVTSIQYDPSGNSVGSLGRPMNSPSSSRTTIDVYSGTVSASASKLTARSTGEGNSAGSAGQRSGSRSARSRSCSPSITSRTVSVVPSTSNAIRPSNAPSFTGFV